MIICLSNKTYTINKIYTTFIYYELIKYFRLVRVHQISLALITLYHT